MLTLKQHLVEEQNTHMEHIEDLIFNDGVNGTRQAINFLRDLRDMLAGKSQKAINMTVKWDGAPAIFAGVDPADKKFFVAKKGLFNINPIMYKSVDDIKNDNKLQPELKKKFEIAYKQFSKLGIRRGVYQGDLMFTKGDVKSEQIDGKSYYTFHPNTILYAVDASSDLGKFINRAQIGVVWHTTYSGRSIKDMKASFGKDIVSKFRKNRNVWMDDATYKDVSGSATFTADETTAITSILSQAGSTFRRIDGDVLRTIAADEELKQKIKTYNNTYVRSGEPFPNPKSHTTGLYKYIQDWYQKEIDKKKTQKAKDDWSQKRDNIMAKIFSKTDDLVNIFTLMNQIVDAKQMVVDKLNKAEGLGTFLRTSNGFKTTNREGYVAIDSSGAVKLVDRLEFSRANFSPEIIKGWQK
tara:strand:- start:3493 stop:4722 length:1230 start_codon:yes stop_codon:yes gene_type:complete